MKKTGFFITLILVALFAIIPLFSVGAAGSTNEKNTVAVITGTVENVVVETDAATNVTTILVTYRMENGKSATVRLSVEIAIDLKLVQTETQEIRVVSVNDQMTGQRTQLDPESVIIDEGGSPLPADVQITGMIQALEVQVDEATKLTTVLVTLLVDGQEVPSSYRINPETAEELQLVAVETQMVEVVIPNESIFGQSIDLDPTDILEEVGTSNPIGQILGDFFASLFGVDPAVIGEYHEQGMGYGVIAQAGIMSYTVGGDGSMMQTILEAKLSGDFSTVILPDGSMVENWGQLRQSIMKQENALKNLGNIVSGHADEAFDEGVDEPAAESTGVPEALSGNINNTPPQPGNQDHPGNGNSNNNGGGSYNDHGNSKPDNPGNSNAPGQNQSPAKPEKGKGHNK